MGKTFHKDPEEIHEKKPVEHRRDEKTPSKEELFEEFLNEHDEAEDNYAER
jgi:hypothetical protein